jgi:ribosomal protein S18 acetylase RimI-like enzyme
MTTIRHLSIGDLAHISQHLGRSIHWKGYLATRLRAKRRALLVAEEGEILVGYIELAIVERGWRVRTPLLDWMRFQLLPSYGSKPDAALLPFRYGLIRDIFVAPGQRREGLGTKLVQAGLEWLRGRGLDRAQAAIRENNPDGGGFFSALGFEPIQFLVRKRLKGELVSPNMEIHFANHNDLPQLAELLRDEISYQVALGGRNLGSAFQLAPDLDWKRFASAKLKEGKIKIFILKQGDQAVGFLEGHLTGRGRHRRGYIEDVYVRPEHRHKGYATTLVHDCFHWCQSQQVDQVQASIWAGNEDSLRFFGNLGFVAVKKMLIIQAHPSMTTSFQSR